ncbi:hypothetical protein [Saccharothrix deserti]|uniref:hypothetical protein n=1 Tax=Saccharothrix deserti TaxID=2593674 RepID=UPI00131D5FAB|nr:hypothetical protein [Saccharothrix deserti]
MELEGLLTPGPNAKPEVVTQPGTDWYGLRLTMDPGEVVLGLPEGEDGRERLAAFLTELARCAYFLAGVLDPSPNHALMPTLGHGLSNGTVLSDASIYGESGPGSRGR